jgi:hypothetical protein
MTHASLISVLVNSFTGIKMCDLHSHTHTMDRDLLLRSENNT